MVKGLLLQVGRKTEDEGYWCNIDSPANKYLSLFFTNTGGLIKIHLYVLYLLEMA